MSYIGAEPITVVAGGTGRTTLTNHGILVGAAGAAITQLGVGNTNTVLLGNTASDPTFGTVPNAALTNSSVTLSSGNNITVTGGGPLALGGTASLNLTGTTNHAVQIGNATNSLTSLAVGTNGQLLCGSTAADPAFTTLTSTGSTLTYTTGAHTLNIDVTAPLTVPNGGTGRTTLTNHGVLIGAATAAITQLAAAAANTLLQGQGAADPSFTGSPSVSGTMTAATGITATSGAITATAGNVVITAGNLTLSNTNTGGTSGIISLGGSRWISNFGTRNNFVGQTSGNTTITGTDNNCLGSQTGNALTSGSNNNFIGSFSGDSITTGVNNVGLGSSAVVGGVGSSASYNTAIGTFSLAALTTGQQNVALGTSSVNGILNNITTGSYNVAIGSFGTNASGINYNSSESSNILICNSGVLGESNVMRIGTSGSGNAQQNKCFIAGIFGTTVGVSGIPVVVDNAGQMGTVVSSSRFKENINDINEESISIYDLRPVSFNYRNDTTKSKHYGLIAEEVNDAMPKLVVYDHDGLPFTVRYSDLPVLLLNELKKLKQEIELLKKNIN